MPWSDSVVFTVDSKYNYADLNRENNNAYVLYLTAKDLGSSVVLTSPFKTDYTRLSFPTVTAINNIRKNLKDLIGAYPSLQAIVEKTGPEAGTFYAGELSMINNPSVIGVININTNRKQIFDYNEANKLEMSLDLLFDYLMPLSYQYPHCGTLNSGEEGLVY